MGIPVAGSLVSPPYLQHNVTRAAAAKLWREEKGAPLGLSSAFGQVLRTARHVLLK